MRKLFTLAAAVLASLAMNADVIFGPFTLTTETNVQNQVNAVTGGSAVVTTVFPTGGSNEITIGGQTFYKFNSSSAIKCSLAEDATFAAGDSIVILTASHASSKKTTGIKLNNSIAVTGDIPGGEAVELSYIVAASDGIDGANSFTINRNNSDSKFGTVTIYRGTVAPPSTDPVSLVEIAGPTACYANETVTFTISTDVKATAYQWAVDGVEQDGETAKTFSFKPTAVGTYQITGQARNEYNEVGAWASSGISLVVTEKPAAVPCAELYPAAAGDTPAKDAKAALTDASYGGNIIFAGAKDGKYAESFQYNEYGLQMCKGGADSVRVELGFKLAVGSKIELHITVGTMCDTKERGFNLLAPGQKKVLGAVWKPKATADATDSIVSKVFEYEVTASDKLAGQNTFGLQRSNSAILQAIIVSDCGEEIVPATDPVTSVTLAGPAEGFVGQTYSFKATADADVDDWIWYVNDVAVDGAKAATFAFTPDAVGTYTIKAGARNGYNPEDGWINSNEIALVVSEALEQVSVSANTEWDWTKAASVNEIKFTDTTSPKKNERCLLANVAGMNNNAEFNSQALLFEGEFAVRDGKYCQGQLLQFNTTVAGYVSVEYSNTGNRDEGQDLERILTVNGVKVGEGALRSDATVKEFNIPVEAGDVALSSVLKADESPQYIRIYKVEFSTEKVIPEGLEEIDATAKAVKVIYNGQLLIKKGDVFYNAQGVVVK